MKGNDSKVVAIQTTNLKDNSFIVDQPVDLLNQELARDGKLAFQPTSDAVQVTSNFDELLGSSEEQASPEASNPHPTKLSTEETNENTTSSLGASHPSFVTLIDSSENQGDIFTKQISGDSLLSEEDSLESTLQESADSSNSDYASALAVSDVAFNSDESNHKLSGGDQDSQSPEGVQLATVFDQNNNQFSGLTTKVSGGDQDSHSPEGAQLAVVSDQNDNQPTAQAHTPHYGTRGRFAGDEDAINNSSSESDGMRRAAGEGEGPHKYTFMDRKGSLGGEEDAIFGANNNSGHANKGKGMPRVAAEEEGQYKYTFIDTKGTLGGEDIIRNLSDDAIDFSSLGVRNEVEQASPQPQNTTLTGFRDFSPMTIQETGSIQDEVVSNIVVE